WRAVSSTQYPGGGPIPDGAHAIAERQRPGPCAGASAWGLSRGSNHEDEPRQRTHRWRNAERALGHPRGVRNAGPHSTRGEGPVRIVILAAKPGECHRAGEPEAADRRDHRVRSGPIAGLVEPIKSAI